MQYTQFTTMLWYFFNLFSICLNMDLTKAKLNTNCKIVEMDIPNEKVKIRLMELGLNIGSVLKVLKISALKQTLLVEFNYSCFTLKKDIAKFLNINYV